MKKKASKAREKGKISVTPCEILESCRHPPQNTASEPDGVPANIIKIALAIRMWKDMPFTFRRRIIGGLHSSCLDAQGPKS